MKMNTKLTQFTAPWLATICAVLLVIVLSSCGTPTHLAYLDGTPKPVQIASSSASSSARISSQGGGTVYLEGFEPKSSTRETSWSVVTASDYDKLTRTGRLSTRQSAESVPATSNSLRGETMISSSKSGGRSDLPPTPSYADANMAELDCADDLKTMRQAKLVWTVGGAAKGAFFGALLEGGVAALRGGGRDAVKSATIHGAVTGGTVGAAEGSRIGQQKGAEVVTMKHQARRTEAELAQAINQAQNFNQNVAVVNAKLRKKLGMVADKRIRKSILADASNSLGQIDDQIKKLENFVGDEAASSKRSEMLAKLQTLKTLRSAIVETEQTANAARV